MDHSYIEQDFRGSECKSKLRLHRYDHHAFVTQIEELERRHRPWLVFHDGADEARLARAFERFATADHLVEEPEVKGMYEY